MFVTAPTISADTRRLVPNKWDLIVVPLVFGLIALIAHGAAEMAAPLAQVRATPISLDPARLPDYALRTTLRMLAAMAVSLFFTFTYATLAAKSRRAEMLLIPILDVLQSVPILGYVSFTVTLFLAAFPGSALGAECAAIFAIFTSQAWNMAFSFYQALRTVPRDLEEAARGFRLTPWQRFWRLDVPFAMPSLVWNMMMSMSGGWFFVVAAEAIAVGDRTIDLPGIGSYVAVAIAKEDLGAIGWALCAMVVVILLYDQLLFRPLVAWAEKFRAEQAAPGSVAQSWLLDLARRTRLARAAVAPLRAPARRLLQLRLPDLPRLGGSGARAERPGFAPAVLDRLWLAVLAALALATGWYLVRFLAASLDLGELVKALGLGALTLLRVTVLIVLASLVWVPVGVWIGERPRLATAVQPIAQFLAAFPANLVFPLVVLAILRFDLAPDIWLSPLMMLGAQWYILFNVVAGMRAYPSDLREIAASLRLSGWQRWRRTLLPAIFPYYVTGAITASGGAWNASIVAELASWGGTTLAAHGLGAYIAQATVAADYPRIVLGICVMALYVTLFNRLLWRRLYAYAERRLRFD
jgi:NitT/TauT family transport system permease protein